MKNVAYLIKEWIKRLFYYPVDKINSTQNSNYDYYWKSKRGDKIGTISSWQKERADYIASIIKKSSGPVVIADIGCGDGAILRQVSDSLKNISRRIGYDSSEFALSQAKLYGIETNHINLSNKAVYTSLCETDYYLLLEVLEHIPFSEELLEIAYSKSRKGLFFSFPNTGYVSHRLRLLFGKFPLQWRVVPNEHLRFWTYSDLKWWLRALNYSNFEIKCYKGIPVINKIFPSLFAAGFIVYLEKQPI
jgi:2-polyprenyl-3-methyl-5-hydroxy-6-metoxy-1,4-benzoquinol methylase